MKYKKIMLFFSIAAIVNVLFRSFQVLFTIDDKGFVISAYKSLNYKMIVFQILALGVATTFGALVHRYPEKTPKVSLLLAAASALMGVWIIVDLIAFPLSVMTPVWQSALINFLGLLSGILWIIYSLSELLPVKLPPLVFIVPVLYWIMRLICIFTTINTLALTMGHVLLLLSYCSVLVFMLELAKLMNGMDREYNFKKLLATGICSATLCLTFSIPYLISILLGGNAAAVEGYSPVYLLFVTGVFIVVFLICYFSNNNLKHHRRRHHTHTLKIKARTDRFYTGD